MNVINNMNDKRMFEESFYNETMEKFNKLKELIKNTCPAEFAMPDTNIFDQMKTIIGDIDNLVDNFKSDIAKSDCNDGNNDEFDESNFEDDMSKQKIVEFTTNQMKALMQIQNLEREMKIKQNLLQRKNANVPFLNEESEKIISDYREKINALEKELNEIRDTNSQQQSRRDHNVSKINMDRKHKISDLEKQMDDYRKKISQLEKSKKLADQDRKRVEDLTREIQELRTTRIQLIKQQRKDADSYKKWERTKTLEIAYLQEKERKHKNDMKRMERLHEKQQTVLKRKVEEAKGINKRLQDAMDKSRKIASMRASSVKPQNNDVIQTYMDHELELLMSSVDAKIAMQSLMNDRGTLNGRLINLKSVVNKTLELESEIKQLEQDLDVRNSQITDMRQKVMQTDLESKIKAIPDNFKTPVELRSAMSYMIRAIIEMRDNFTNTKTKAEDLKLAYETSEERIEQLSQQIETEREEMNKRMEKMETDFEEKLGVWYNMMKREGVKLPEVGTEEAMSAQFQSLMKMLGDRAENSEDLQKNYDDLKVKYEKLLGKIDMKSTVNKLARTSTLKTDENEAFASDSDLEVDSEDGFGFNDSFQDPDWVKTPKYRRKTRRTTAAVLKDNLRSLNGTGLLNDISESSDLSGTKRSFQGNAKCSCKGSCATKLCGCKKVGSFCADTCRCSEACVNVPDDDTKDASDGKENGAASQESQDGTDDSAMGSPKNR